MQYKIYKQFPRDDERLCAQFNDLADAKFFLEKKVEADAALKIKVIYRLYKGHDVIQEISSEESTGSTGGGSGGQGRAASSTSGAPTPFATAPKPAGVPNRWGSIDKDEDEKK